jgi:two-component system, NarL family, invasion response regulator UvrY
MQTNIATRPDSTFVSASPLTDREAAFLTLACSELTYTQIADRMNLSPRTIDGYREVLFEKLSVKNRVGLALWAIRLGLVVV